MPSPVRRLIAPLIAVVFVLGACGGQAATPAPTPIPTPSPSPDPHLADPVSVDMLIAKLSLAGIPIQPTNASTGESGEPIKTVNATFDGWPLSLSQFSSAGALRQRLRFDASKPPRAGDSVYMLVGLNILVEYGPTIHGPGEKRPQPRFRDDALRLMTALDPLLGPLQQRSIDPLPLPTPTPLATPARTQAPPASPKPTAKPTAKPTTKPTAKPTTKPKTTPRPTRSP